MTKFYCKGKKGICHRDMDCEASETMEKCKFFNGCGGKEIKIKPLRMKHRFLRWIKRLLGIKSPSEEWIRGARNIDEVHAWKETLKNDEDN